MSQFNGMLEESLENSIEQCYLLFEFSLEVISILSVLLYCPIFISIRTKLHLVSAVQSKPDRYIRYQAVFICLSKLISILIMSKIAWFGYIGITELKWVRFLRKIGVFFKPV
uniref:G_PROTEIN_RECEP_F1_2 domain-containing protein n=1 Tax=Caenorhabditis tropicalis TaxID=1561998 RepID=A0A1I7TGX6_9PELO